jgi:hypothetical protein
VEFRKDGEDGAGDFTCGEAARLVGGDGDSHHQYHGGR